MCCRVTLTGRTPLHGELYADGQAVRAEIVGQAIIAGQDRLVIERVRVETEPMLTAAEISSRGDAVAELQELLMTAATDSVFLQSLRAEFEVLLSKMPSEVWTQDMPALRDVREGRLAELIESVTPGVVDRIQPRH